MIQFLDTYSEQLLLYVVFFILGLTLMVLVVALTGRMMLLKRREYRKQKSNLLGELIIRYVSGELSIDKIKTRLKRRLDFIILLELVSKLEESLEGAEKTKLNELIDIEEIRNHFEKRFYSDVPILQAKACLYFTKKSDIPAIHLPELVKHTENKDPILCYAATSALIVHGDLKDKTNALQNALSNKNISDMALSDLLVQFTEHGNEYHEEEVNLIMSLIEDESIPSRRTAVLIRILNELDYFHSSKFLWKYYQKLDPESANPEVLESLMNVLTKFGHEEVVKDIHHYFAVSDHASLRKAAAQSLGFFGKEVSIPVLSWLLNDRDFMVRFEAAQALGKYNSINLEELSPPGISKKEWKELAGEVMSESQNVTVL